MNRIQAANLQAKIGVLARRVPVYAKFGTEAGGILSGLFIGSTRDAAKFETVMAEVASEYAVTPVPRLIDEIDNSFAANQISCVNQGEAAVFDALLKLRRKFKILTGANVQERDHVVAIPSGMPRKKWRTR